MRKKINNKISDESLIKVRNVRYCKKQGEIVDPKQEPTKPGLVPLLCTSSAGCWCRFENCFIADSHHGDIVFANVCLYQ